MFEFKSKYDDFSGRKWNDLYEYEKTELLDKIKEGKKYKDYEWIELPFRIRKILKEKEGLKGELFTGHPSDLLT